MYENQPPPPARQRTAQTYRTLASSICPPAVRTVVVEATATPHEGGFRTATAVHQVLALASTTRQQWESRYTGPERPSSAGTVADLAKRGWVLVDQADDLQPLVIDEEAGHLTEYVAPDNAAHRLVACTWPTSEDDARLAPIVERLTRELLDEQQRKAGKGVRS